MAEPVAYRGWDLDFPDAPEGRLAGKDEGGLSAEVDQGHEDCLDQGRSPMTPLVPSFS